VPSASTEVVASKATASPVALEVNAAVGGVLAGGAWMVTCWLVLPVAPPLSVTVSFTVKVPAAA